MKKFKLILITLSAMLIFFGGNAWGQYVVDFEGNGETKGAYASGTVTLSGLDWNMTEALIGTLDNDFKNGVRSARMQGYGTSSMTMLQNKSDGIGTVSFEYRRFGTDAQVDWRVEYSTNNGSTWTQIGSDFTAPASDVVQTFSESVNVSGDVRIRIKRATESGTTNRRLNIDDIEITDYVGTTPTITVTPATLSGFSYYVGTGPSDEQSFTVSGSNLTHDISIAAPTNYEISTGTGASFSATDPITLTRDGEDVAETPIYVRLKADLAVGNYNAENITASSTGATDKTVACSGFVYDSTTECGNETFDNFGATGTSYQDGTFEGQDGSTWTYTQCRGDYEISGKAIMIGQTRTPQSNFYSGTISGGIGTLNFDYKQAFGTNVNLNVLVNDVVVGNVTSLSEEGTIKNSGDIVVNVEGDFVIKFINVNNNNGQVVIDNVTWTCYVEDCSTPETHSSNIAFSNITEESAEVSWNKGDGTYRMVIARKGSAVTAVPVDGNTYTANNLFGEGDEIDTDQFVVYNGTGESFEMTGLDGGSTYYIRIFEYKCTGGDENYYTADSPPGDNFDTKITGLAAIYVTCTGSDYARVEWSLPSGEYDGIIIGARRTNAPHTLSGDPGLLTANSEFGSGTSYGADNTSYVVYKGTGSSVTVTGLSAPDYIFKGYVYKGTDWAGTTPIRTLSTLGVPEVSNETYVEMNQSVTIGWTNPASDCFDEVIIVVHTAGITGTPTGTYMANSLSYTDVANPDFPLGGKVVYNGTLSPRTITDLTNNTEYNFKIFVRNGDQWSNGVTIVATPNEMTVLDYGDLAILGVNAQLRDSEGLGSVDETHGPDEIIFVMFQDFTTNSTIDFTDNGYERVYEGYWGTTEGVIRLKRTGGTVTAGTVISLRGCNGATNPLWEEHFNIYAGGVLDNDNWEISSINGNTNFNLTTSKPGGDQVWIMQNGVWDTSEGQHRGIYTGKVLYGWSPTGWADAPGYDDTDQSTLYPGSDCSNSNVSGIADKYKVKYKGPIEEAVPRVWLQRIGDPLNWEGWGEDDNDLYFDGGSFGNTLAIATYAVDGNPWIGDFDTDWFDCFNWGNLRVPDSQTNVVIKDGIAEGNVVIAGGEAFCANLTINDDVRSFTINDAATVLNIYGNLLIEENNTLTQNNGTINVYGNWSSQGAYNNTGGAVIFNGESQQSITSGSDLTFNNLTIDNFYGVNIERNIQVNNNFTLTSGALDNTGYSLTVGTGVGSTGSLSYTSGRVNGRIIKWIPQATTGELALPVGKPGLTNPAWVQFTAAPTTGGTLTAEFISDIPYDYYGNLPIEVDGILIDNIADEGFWRIEAGNSLSGGTYNLTLEAGSIEEINIANDIRIVKRETYSDFASNYIVPGWTNGSNQGSGFGNWSLWDDGDNSGFFIWSSTDHGHGDINSGPSSFELYGHSNQWSNAQRSITGWGNGYTLSFDMAVQWRDGGRGVSLFNDGGFAGENEIWNFNINNDGYGDTPWNYYSDIVISFSIYQNGDDINIWVTGTSEGSPWEGNYGTSIENETLGGFRFYTGGDIGNESERNLYFNNLRIAGGWLSEGTASFIGTRFTQEGLSGFSEFALGGEYEVNPMPIELLFFNAQKVDDNVLLSWATASEINNDFFTIERTTDMKKITEIAIISGAGNSKITCNYSHIDYNPLKGISYYRLKQTDYDGSYEYSPWEAINFSEISEGLKIAYLHSNNGITNLGISRGNEQIIHIKAYDIYGRIIYSNTINSTEPLINYSFERGEWPDGIIIIHVYDNKSSETRKGLFYKR